MKLLTKIFLLSFIFANESPFSKFDAVVYPQFYYNGVMVEIEGSLKNESTPLDFKMIMPSLLQMGDRMSSAFGVENRCPFLDKDIIEFGFNLDIDQKLNFDQQKLILRKILKKRTKSKYKEIEKKGLTIKYNKWYNVKSWDRSNYFQFLNKNWKSAYKIKKY